LLLLLLLCEGIAAVAGGAAGAAGAAGAGAAGAGAEGAGAAGTAGAAGAARAAGTKFGALARKRRGKTDSATRRDVAFAARFAASLAAIKLAIREFLRLDARIRKLLLEAKRFAMLSELLLYPGAPDKLG
jgi:hypothetical protein